MTDTTLERCEAWLALADEIDRLTFRWQTLETFLIAADVGFDVMDPYALDRPEAREMAEIDERRDELHRRSHELLEAIPRGEPVNRETALAKLRVASKVLYRFENPELHDLITSALQELEAA